MAAGLNFTSTGFEQLAALLQNAPVGLQRVCDLEMQASVINIATQAKRNASNFSDNGRLASSIAWKKNSLADYSIVAGGANVYYAPWVEFGTGIYVQTMPGTEDYAMTFYINGQGRGRPHPFLFPAFFAEEKKLLANTAAAIQRYFNSNP